MARFSLLPPDIDIKTSLLYGVFASHRSFITGIRNLVKREYVIWLAWKTIEDRLSQELVDLIADELYQLEKDTVASQWKKCFDFSGNAAHFARAPSDTRSYAAAMRRIEDVAPGVTGTIVSNDRPLLQPADQPRQTVTYIHLSAVKRRPTLAINLPPMKHQDWRTNALAYPTGGRGYTSVRLTQANGISQDCAAYRSTDDWPSIYGDDEKPEVSRLLQCEGVEDAIRDWDARALQKFVDLLDLRMVPFDSADAMNPGLHILQTISEE